VEEEGINELLAEDAFNAAFDSFAADGAGAAPETPPSKEPPAAKVVEAAPETPAAAEPAAETKPEPVVVAAPATAAEIAQELGKVVKALTPAPAEKPAPAAVVEEDIDPPEVVEALKDLGDNWGTHKVAIEALLTKQEKRLRAEFAEIMAPLQAQMVPIAASQQDQAQARFEADLKAAHSDAYDILPSVEKWISEQPPLMQAGYNKVLDEGSVADVSQFLTVFKQLTSHTPAPAADTGAAAKEAAQAAAQEKLEKMETPTPRRTSVTAEPDLTDFDSAFEAGAKAVAATV
jgi:hypothetical protein